MKVAELEGARLDFWVAQHSPQCINLRFELRGDHWVGIGEIDGKYEVIIAGAAPGFFAGQKVRKLYGKELMAVYRPSSDWSQAGLLIERERIDINTTVEGWEAYCDINQKQRGDTALEAAMRAYVASKFGEEVPDDRGVTADAGSIPSRKPD